MTHSGSFSLLLKMTSDAMIPLFLQPIIKPAEPGQTKSTEGQGRSRGHCSDRCQTKYDQYYYFGPTEVWQTSRGSHCSGKYSALKKKCDVIIFF